MKTSSNLCNILAMDIGFSFKRAIFANYLGFITCETSVFHNKHKLLTKKLTLYFSARALQHIPSRSKLHLDRSLIESVQSEKYLKASNFDVIFLNNSKHGYNSCTTQRTYLCSFNPSCPTCWVVVHFSYSSL